ncbi:MAG: response regulator transcription factor [Bacteroidales bacterium]|nr:response regulator transcription factor [Bacteroidales bacterium]
MENIKILIVEDHALTRMGTIMAMSNCNIPCQVVAEASTVKEAKAILGKYTDIDLILLDLMLPDGNGREVLHYLRSYNQNAKVLIISADTDKNTILELMQLGISGFISKYSNPDTLAAAIDSVCNGMEYFGKDISEIIHAVSTAKKPIPGDSFTARELEIMRLCAQGLSVKMIADELNISNRTVENHKNNIFKKLGFNSTGELIHYVFENGIVY